MRTDNAAQEHQTERMTWHEAVTMTAAIVHAKFPAIYHSRIETGTALVLAGAVWGEDDGVHFAVRSSADPNQYYWVNGACACPDAQYRAPNGICKHRAAVGIYRRAGVLQGAPRPAPQHLLDAPAPVLPPTFPEAPASVNCHITIGGRQVQLTLRDTDERRLLARLATVLADYPAHGYQEERS